MSIHISSISELTSFLKNLKETNSVDPASNSYKMSLEGDKKYYNIKNSDKDKKLEEDEDALEDEDPLEDEGKESEPEKITPTLDSLIRNINNLRSGQSLNRGEIRDQVAQYFDGLKEDEQSTLILFLRELAAVVTQRKTGDEAKEPSQAVTNKDDQSKEKEETDMQSQTSKKESEPAGIEDTEAPIKVNESQDLSREKIIFEHNQWK